MAFHFEIHGYDIVNAVGDIYVSFNNLISISASLASFKSVNFLRNCKNIKRVAFLIKTTIVL